MKNIMGWLQSEEGFWRTIKALCPCRGSLTKVATTLAALRTWGPTYQFVTLVDAQVRFRTAYCGGLDVQVVATRSLSLKTPWRCVSPQELGLKQVTGKLIISGDFFMNFTTNPALSGKLLHQVFSPPRQRAGRKRHRVVAPENHGLTIAGPVEVVSFCPPIQGSLVRHRSLPLFKILKRMNVYSNNAMAEMFTAALGGLPRMVQQASDAAGVPAEDLHLINGSGLGPENQLSARTVCALFSAIHRLVTPARLTVADVFPVAGIDRGTIRRRHLPVYTIVKTGTLRHVATLAGVILTRAHGPVWFALLNQGSNLWGFRTQQDALLQYLIAHWGVAEPPPASFIPTSPLTDTIRNDIVIRTKTGGG
jgi:D-alanyl-D-alanine carboxypeptidase/D-alanyl-D-alanine-endopeptidase (penicillin-binding protein 4)